MQQDLDVALSESRTALSRLLRSQGKSDQATAAALTTRGDDDDDDDGMDEIVDETDVVERKALQELRNQAVDLEDLSVQDAVAATQAATRAQQRSTPVDGGGRGQQACGGGSACGGGGSGAATNASFVKAEKRGGGVAA